jgi:hypothetical protein
MLIGCPATVPTLPPNIALKTEKQKNKLDNMYHIGYKLPL